MDILKCEEEYNNGSILSERSEVTVEARRVILNEELDKLANLTLSNLKVLENTRDCSKKKLDWENDQFWKEIPNPSLDHPPLPPNQDQEIINLKKIGKVNEMITKTLSLYKIKQTMRVKTGKKYAKLWKKALNKTKNTPEKPPNEKLKSFFEKLELAREAKKQKALEAMKMKTQEIKKQAEASRNQSKCYENRFKAQKSLIESQKAQLEEQSKTIQELKLGLIREGLMQSLEKNKVDIREIFANASTTTKSQMQGVCDTETRSKFMVSTQKAPKIIQKMEQRALERAQNREVIQERKRILEEKRQRILAEAMERKKVLEEEDRKKALEEIKERRRKELELEKTKLMNKEKFLNNLNRAISFHNRKLILKHFNLLKRNLEECRENATLAVQHFENAQKTKFFSLWVWYVESKYKLKYEIAEAHFGFKTLKRCLATWQEEHKDFVKKIQVAEDFYEYYICCKYLKLWERNVNSLLYIQEKKRTKADHHYQKRMLLRCFYQWKTLKAVLELERALEEKKKKWREKVWQILPDYNPPQIDV